MEGKRTKLKSGRGFKFQYTNKRIVIIFKSCLNKLFQLFLLRCDKEEKNFFIVVTFIVFLCASLFFTLNVGKLFMFDISCELDSCYLNGKAYYLHLDSSLNCPTYILFTFCWHCRSKRHSLSWIYTFLYCITCSLCVVYEYTMRYIYSVCH